MYVLRDGLHYFRFLNISFKLYIYDVTFGVFDHIILLLIIIVYKLTLYSFMEVSYKLFMLFRYVCYAYTFNPLILSIDILCVNTFMLDYALIALISTWFLEWMKCMLFVKLTLMFLWKRLRLYVTPKFF